MPRLYAPYVVQHVIVRFVDRNWYLRSGEERLEYLHRVDRFIGRSDWALLGYALMSSHVHFLFEAGLERLCNWSSPLHGSMSAWLNQRFSGLGSTIANRPYSELVSPKSVPIVLAYIHNNPVRARVVDRAGDSDWTSHRAYLGLDAGPRALNVRRGLELCGFEHDDRAGFDSWVQSRSLHSTEDVRIERQMLAIRAQVRSQMGSEVEVATPVVTPQAREVTLVRHSLSAPRAAPTYEDADCVLDATARACGIESCELHGSYRGRQRTHARRVAVRVWDKLGGDRVTIARKLGITHQAVAKLARSTGTTRVHDSVDEVCAAVEPQLTRRVSSPA